MKLGRLLIVLTLIFTLVGPQVALAGFGGTYSVSQSSTPAVEQSVDNEVTTQSDNQDRRGRMSFLGGANIFWWQYISFLRYLGRW
ncbi:MAG: hypothetical protein HKN20_07925 [Gemmatimonadetes bacterium]|nr:hypothetical protein [Gemmatimonadota bacterium]